MSRIIVPRRDLILPNRHKQRGFIISPYRFASGGGYAALSRDGSGSLTDGGKTFTSTTAGWGSASAKDSPKSEGKFLFAIRYNVVASNGLQGGVAYPGYAINTLAGAGSYFIQQRQTSARIYANTSLLSGPGVVQLDAGEVMWVAVDLDGRKINYRNQGGGWIAGSDPDAWGGFALHATNEFFPYICLVGVGTSATLLSDPAEIPSTDGVDGFTIGWPA